MFPSSTRLWAFEVRRWTPRRAARVCVLAAAAVGALAQQAELKPRLGSVDNSAALRYEYLLGPDDLLTIRVATSKDFPGEPVAVDPSGNIKLPIVGRVRAAGLTLQGLEDELTERLAPYYRDPQVTATVTEYRSQPASVGGAIQTPGVVQIRGRKRLLEVISEAGGLRQDAGSYVVLTRRAEWGQIPIARAVTDDSQQYNVVRINVRDVMMGAHPEENIEIKPHDVISALPADSVFVLGEVPKAGAFPLLAKDRISVLEALSMAGGASRTASLGDARILRAEGQGPRSEIPIDLKRIMNGQMTDPALQPDDILFVPSSATRRFTARAIEAAIQLGTGVLIWRR